MNCSVLKVFSKARVQFSVGGQHYHGRSVWYTYMPDTVLENARDVDIQLHNHVGKYVKIQLYFSNKWIMISEVKFDSGECSLDIVLTTVIYIMSIVYSGFKLKYQTQTNSVYCQFSNNIICRYIINDYLSSKIQ